MYKGAKTKRREEICKDSANYNIQILRIMETYYQTEKNHKDKNNKSRNYQTYHGGPHNNAYVGVGIIIKMNGNTKLTYQKVTNRIIKTRIQVDKAYHMNVTVADALILVKIEACPKDR